LVVTHNAQIAQIADVAIKVRDGRVESLKANPQPLPVEEVQW
jgi:ABC-type lipoprotein export system ATPase subunit